MESVHRLITALDYCQREGAATVKERIQRRHADSLRRARSPIALNFAEIAPRPVYARIELGQVCADCECGGCEFVCIEEPIFYCFQCFNRIDGGSVRPVIFPDPETWNEIARLVLLRPVDDVRGADEADRAAGARAIIYIEKPDGQHLPLTRSWNPNETIEDLVEENQVVEAWITAQLKVSD